MWQIAKDGDWAARRQLQKQFPVVSWHDDKVGGLDANWNCEAPISELCIFKQMIQNVIAFFFLPTSSVWQSNKGLWQETSWNHSRWLPGASESMPLMHSHPLPCKKLRTRTACSSRPSGSWDAWGLLPLTLCDLGSAGLFDAPFLFVYFPKDEVLFAPGQFWQLPWPCNQHFSPCLAKLQSGHVLF